MMLKFFEMGDCPICQSLRREGIISTIEDAFKLQKFRVDLTGTIEDVKMWAQRCRGKVPALYTPNPPTWYIGYDPIKAFAQKCEGLGANEIFPTQTPFYARGFA